MIDQKKLKELIKLMVDNDLTELDLQDQSEHVSLKRAHANPDALVMPAAPALPQAAPPESDEQSPFTPIVSPMVGTFYAAASPDTDLFVKIGDQVEPDTVVCIIEAMKVFNEIKADVAGTVEKVVAQNGHPVEFGQSLFLIKPR